MDFPKDDAAPLQLIYQWQEGVEDLEGYQPGGYHPTHIGDEYIDGRYEVVHKLGYGTYSTVWLAKDRQENQYVALKILVADASKTSSESKILRALESGNRDHPGRAYVSSLVDEFTIDGPNGRHLCLVSEAAGCSLADSKDASITWKFPVNVARSISAQILRGLDYIHSCGIVHADLHSNNILLKLPTPGHLTAQQLYERLGEPQHLPVERLDKCPNGPEVPRYCVPPAMIFQACDEVENAHIVISDFGEAFLQGEKRNKLHSPILLIPPEEFFHEPLGQAVDVWTLGCTLYEVLGERPLFEGFMPDEDHALAEMISTLGPLPKRWWDRWEKKRDFFLEDGSWDVNTKRAHSPHSRPLLERLGDMGREEDFGEEELAVLEKLLKAMLTYEPAERITTRAAIESEWMKRYGGLTV